MQTEGVRCDLRLVSEYPCVDPGDSKKKHGRYHRSAFWDVPKFGSKRWVLAVKIDLDFGSPSAAGLSEEDLARECVKYLNVPPLRKKYAKKKPKPKYGILEYYRSQIVEKGSDKYISALLIVNERKNRLFWGKGRSV